METIATPRIVPMHRRLQHPIRNRTWPCRQSRDVMTESIEAPLDCQVRERPCMVVLTEDLGFYNGTSWRSCFGRLFPKHYGIQFCYMQLKGLTLLKTGLAQMEQDLASQMNVVLVAKGPLVSWLAQYYLESLPLSGLVMVDPIEITHNTAAGLKLFYPPNATEQQLLDSICCGHNDRPLLLEPGILPMLVLSTRKDFVHNASWIASRHSDPAGEFGKFEVTEVEGASNNEVTNLIHCWIDEKVL